MTLPITNVDYQCPHCLRVLKPPVRMVEAVTWTEGVTRHYAHARCLSREGDREGVDSSGIVLTDQSGNEAPRDSH